MAEKLNELFALVFTLEESLIFPLHCQGWRPILCSGAGSRDIRI